MENTPTMLEKRRYAKHVPWRKIQLMDKVNPIKAEGSNSIASASLPFELIWAAIKWYVVWKNTTFEFGDVKRLPNEDMVQVIMAKWTIRLENIIKVETKIRGLDGSIDKTVVMIIDHDIIHVSYSEYSE